jgi:hypothetical protein
LLIDARRPEVEPTRGLAESRASRRPLAATEVDAAPAAIRLMIEMGTTAPDFTLADQDGNAVHLADPRGKTVVLWFYPRADTRRQRPVRNLREGRRRVEAGCRYWVGWFARRESNGDIAQKCVPVNADDAVAVVGVNRRDVVTEIASHDATEQLDADTRPHQNIDIAKDRVRVDRYLGWGAPGVGEVDRHVAEERHGDQLILDIPRLGPLSLAAGFEDRVQRQQPSPPPAHDRMFAAYRLSLQRYSSKPFVEVCRHRYASSSGHSRGGCLRRMPSVG